MTASEPALPDTTQAGPPAPAPQGPSQRPTRKLAHLAGRRAVAHPHNRGYSRLVGFLKFLLPGVALAIVVIISLWQNLFGDGSTTLLQQVDGSMVGDRLLSPRFVGTDARDRPFTLEADYADQLSRDSTIVTFSQPRGELVIEDGFLDMTAERGRFDREAELLVLEDSVGIRRSDGSIFNTEELHVDLPNNRAWSDVAVDGSGSFGHIEAEGGIEILNGGETVLFKGPARLILSPSSGRSLP